MEEMITLKLSSREVSNLIMVSKLLEKGLRKELDTRELDIQGRMKLEKTIKRWCNLYGKIDKQMHEQLRRVD